MSKKSNRAAEFPYALKSFLGHLEGTGKSLHTISNYRLDLLAFERFLQEGLSDRPVKLEALSAADLERFHQWMKKQGLKANTRRRKLLTVQKFFKYLFSRNKISEVVARKIPTPQKIERVPPTVRSAELLERIRSLPRGSVIESRNRALLWTLAETGALVSEVIRLRFEQWEKKPGGEILLHLSGKNERTLTLSSASKELYEAIRELESQSRGSPWVFPGFNKFGPLGGPITARGVELLVKSYEARFQLPGLTPRILRHSAVLRWHEEGAPVEEIQKRLGLKTRYAFRAYEVLFRSSSKATSSSGKNPPES